MRVALFLARHCTGPAGMGRPVCKLAFTLLAERGKCGSDDWAASGT